MKREADLYPHVRAWLEKQGYTVHVEMFDHDVIGVRDGLIPGGLFQEAGR